MKSLSSKTYQCGVTIQGLTTLSGTVYLTGITNTASWDHVIVGTTAQGQIYTRTYAQFMGDVATGISLSSYVTGSGTTNYLPKFTAGSALGNSQIFDNGTNVGIGTASPISKLQVNGQFRQLYSRAFISNPLDSDGYAGHIIVNSNNANGDLAGIGLYTNSSYNAAAGLFALQESSTAASMVFYAGSNLATERMRITSGGNILINTTNSPTAGGFTNTTLSVKQVADGLYGGGLHIEENATTSVAYFGFNGIAFNIGTSYRTTGDYRPIAFSTNGAERLRIANDGNIGIGTTSPSYKLQVNGDGNGLYVLGANIAPYTQTIASFVYGGNGNSINIENQGGKASIQARAGGSTMDLLLNPAGSNVGIGTVSPTAKFQVTDASSSITLQNYLNGAAIFLDGVNGDFIGADYFHILADGSSYLGVGGYAGGATPLNVSNSGNVGIGTSGPNEKLTVWTASTTGLQTALRLNNPFGFANQNTGSQIVFSQDRSTAEDLKQGIIAVGQQDAGTSASSYMAFSTNNTGLVERMRITSGGNVGIGTTSPSTLLDVSGVITATGGNSTNWNTAYGWGNHASASYVPQARTLTINGTSYDLSANRTWTISTATPGGSDTQVQYNSSGSLAGASALTYNSTTNRVGINQASPGYDLDVNGQVRVQDKLRVGTGNGVVHMSSTATINASATTVVWAQTVSVGMCAFIEYYILNSTSLTDQRAGTIMVTWNQSGTPTITHTETTTPDIGSTTTVNFTSSLVGSDARINAVNSSANPYTMVMSYKYF